MGVDDLTEGRDGFGWCPDLGAWVDVIIEQACHAPRGFEADFDNFVSGYVIHELGVEDVFGAKAIG